MHYSDWHLVTRETFQAHLSAGADPTVHRDVDGFWFLTCRPMGTSDPLKRFVLGASRGGVRSYRTFEAVEMDLDRMLDAAGVMDAFHLVVDRRSIELGNFGQEG